VTFSLKAVLDDVIKLLSTRMKDVKISIDVQEDVEVLSYRSEYQQVLLVILHNAIDNFEACSIKDRQIDIVIRSYQDKVYLSIEDNGRGIEKKHLPHIFDPYFTTKFSHEGIGLGLYMANMLVESSMGGSLGVENSARGAKFMILIPKIGRRKNV
jgi:C4-dicarboxylate-specific signal transduction histidine kinase